MAVRSLLAAIILVLPTGTAAQSRDASLHAFLQSTFADARAETPQMAYTAAFADLNSDGRQEALVMPHAGLFCGSGGCALYIYTRYGAAWRQVDEQTIVGQSVRLLPTRTRGWRDLAVNIRGGGFDLPRQIRLRFNGQGYRAGPILRGNAGRLIMDEATPSRPLFQ